MLNFKYFFKSFVLPSPDCRNDFLIIHSARTPQSLLYSAFSSYKYPIYSKHHESLPFYRKLQTYCKTSHKSNNLITLAQFKRMHIKHSPYMILQETRRLLCFPEDIIYVCFLDFGAILLTREIR